MERPLSHPIPPPESARRQSNLDCIRGVGAVSVMVFHCLWHIVLIHDQTSLPARFASWFLSYLDLGKFGVVVFFATSGYVIPFSLNKGKSHPVASFLISRFFRLYPAYWVSLFLGSALLWRWTIGWKLFLANATMLQSFFRLQDALGVYWTLQIELVFYAVCAILLRLGLARSRTAFRAGLWTCLVGALTLALLRHRGWAGAPVALPLGLAVMFWGDAVRHARSGPERGNALWSTIPVLAFLGPVCVLGYGAAGSATALRYALTYLVGLAFFFRWANRPDWTTPWLTFLGRISFSIYLLHPVAMGIDRLVPAGTNPWATSAAVVALTIAAAWACHTFVELPAIGWGQRLRARIDR